MATAGDTYGKLVVIKQARKKLKYTKSICWICQCECGQFVTVPATQLHNGNTQSCGCIQRQRVRKRKYKIGEASRNKIYKRYIKGAKDRQLCFQLSIEEFHKLSQQNCFYCGSPPSNEDTTGRYNGSYIYNGIDRIDNNIGYILSNCVPCCRICNRAKSSLSQNDFMTWVNQLVQYKNGGD